MTSRTESLFFRGLLLLAVLSLLGVVLVAAVTFLTVRSSSISQSVEGAAPAPLLPFLPPVDAATISALRATAIVSSAGLISTALLIAGLTIPARRVQARFGAVQRHLVEISSSGSGQPVLAEGRDELAALGRGINRVINTFHERAVEAESATADRFQPLQAHLRAYQAVARILGVVTAIDSLPEVLSTATALLVETFAFDHVGLFLIDEATKQPVLQAVSSEQTRSVLVAQRAMGEDGSVLARALQTGLPQSGVSHDADACPTLSGDLSRLCLRLAIPLKVRNRVMGAIEVESLHAEVFSTDVITALSLLADQIGLIIASSRPVLEGREAPGARTLHDPERGRLDAVGASTIAFHFNGLDAVPVEKPLDMTEAMRPEIVERTGGIRELRAPIIAGDQVLGSIVFRQPTQAPAWGDDALAFVVSEAGQVGQAIERSRLMTEARDRDSWRQLQGQVVQRLWASTADAESVLNTAVTELEAALGARGELLRVGVQDSAEMECQGEVQVPTQADIEEADGGRLLVHLFSYGRCLGRILLERDTHRWPWAAEELALARMVGVQAGLALERVHQTEDAASYREAAEQRLNQEREVIEAVQRLDALSDTDLLLQAATRELQTLLEASAVVVSLGPVTAPLAEETGPIEQGLPSGGQEVVGDG